MTNPIEETDRRQQRYWKWFLTAFVLLLLLLAIRHLLGTTLNEYELNSHPVGISLLALKLVLLFVMVLSIVKLGRLRSKAAADPQLKEALIDDELVKLHVAQSWKAGFIAAAVTPCIFLLLSLEDPVSVAFATPIIGSAAFLLTFYLKSNK